MHNQNEQACLRSGTAERLLDLISAHTDRMIYTWTQGEPRATTLTPALCSAAGFPETLRLEPRHLRIFVLADSAKKAQALFRQAMDGVDFAEECLHAQLPGRESRWYHVRVTSAPAADGNRRLCLLSLRDITEERRNASFYQRAVQQYQADAKNIARIEADLTDDRLELIEGFAAVSGSAGHSYAETADRIVQKHIEPVFAEKAQMFFGRDTLLQLAAAGAPRAEAEFPGFMGPDKRDCWMHVLIRFVADPTTGHTHMYAVVTNVTEEHASRQKLIDESMSDGMTGTLNHASIEAQVNQHLRADSAPGCMLFFDIDNFKHYNDTFGHQAGDEILLLLVKTIRTHFRASDILGRVGGDEFVVYLPNADGEAGVAASVERLLDRIRELHLPGREESRFSVSIGCAYGIPGKDDFVSLYARADTAMYAAKETGKNRYMFYDWTKK